MKTSATTAATVATASNTAIAVKVGSMKRVRLFIGFHSSYFLPVAKWALGGNPVDSRLLAD